MRQEGIYDKPDLRLMVEAMLYRMRVGCPWRDLPTEFGSWNSIYQKFNRWSSQNKLMKIFKSLVQEPDLDPINRYHKGQFTNIDTNIIVV